MVFTFEGIGNEVVQFFFCVFVIFIGCLLWVSTRVRNAEEPFFRTVYVLERRVREAEPTSNAHIMDRTNEGTPLSTESVSNHPVVTYSEVISSESNNSERSSERTPNVEHLKPNNEAVTGATVSESPSSTNAPVNTKDNDSKIEDKVSRQSESNIKVRLKYTNDDSREVQGILQEKLVDFKRRNFPEEMSANKLIRLIFNGRLLRDDNVSLQSYGLFDDCVVHCLIINERPSQSANNDQEQPQSYSMNNGQPAAPEWRLNKMFWFIIVTFLSALWYCRIQFTALFTLTSTSFLVGLTAIFLGSLFSTLYGMIVPLNSTG